MEQTSSHDRKKILEGSLPCDRTDCFLYYPRTGRCMELVYDKQGRDIRRPCPFYKTHLQQQESLNKAWFRQQKKFGCILSGPGVRVPETHDNPLEALADE